MVGPGENIQIMIRDDNIVLDLGRTGLAGEFVCHKSNKIDNIL